MQRSWLMSGALKPGMAAQLQSKFYPPSVAKTSSDLTHFFKPAAFSYSYQIRASGQGGSSVHIFQTPPKGLYLCSGKIKRHSLEPRRVRLAYTRPGRTGHVQTGDPRRAMGRESALQTETSMGETRRADGVIARFTREIREVARRKKSIIKAGNMIIKRAQRRQSRREGTERQRRRREHEELAPQFEWLRGGSWGGARMQKGGRVRAKTEARCGGAMTWQLDTGKGSRRWASGMTRMLGGMARRRRRVVSRREGGVRQLGVMIQRQ
ncbi:hypothetical protein B0H14DRAFT_2629078 [Mycena olivaceomarginata]|nr:hypothetical protein B0H14DRAFT_2629078 [Mycena olivaceomarginata]